MSEDPLFVNIKGRSLDFNIIMKLYTPCDVRK